MARSSFLIVLIATICGAIPAFGATANITTNDTTPWGEWGSFERCPNGTYAHGFQLKSERFQGIFSDDTALNGIRLFCGDPDKNDTAVITSAVGPFGDWGKVFKCDFELNGFQILVEPPQGAGDDTAANNIGFYCSSLTTTYFEGDGLSFSTAVWSPPQFCPGSGLQFICGIQTKVDMTPNKSSGCKCRILSFNNNF